MIPRPATFAGAATVIAIAGAIVAARADVVAGVVLVAIAVAIACYAFRTHLRQESPR